VEFEESFYLSSAADHWPIGTSFVSYALTGVDYKENVTYSWAEKNNYIDLNESFSMYKSVLSLCSRKNIVCISDRIVAHINSI
jgi:hypothetical protein